MINNDTSCIKVSDTGICPKCKSKEIIKNGFTKNSKQVEDDLHGMVKNLYNGNISETSDV
ncbi:MAG: transposase-like zinc-binding domain-containing protein [Flavobacterium sp.]